MLPGAYFMTSTGAGVNAVSVSMSIIWVAGWVSLKTTVWSSLAVTPGRGVSSMYLATLAGVAGLAPVALYGALKSSQNFL